MSAPSIPNLLSTRGSRGSSGRGRGRTREGGSGPSGTSRGGAQDAIIQGTDTDAAVSRFSAVELGYLEDPFAEHFVQASPSPSQRRLPIINRGTYTRTTALDSLIDSFLSSTDSPSDSSPAARQIISLGAGTDTRSFRLFSRSSVRNVIYHELDFASICSKKLGTVQTTMCIRDVLPEVRVDEVLDSGISVWSGQSTTGNQLRCHGLDLRRLTASDEADIPELRGLQDNVPTMLLSECCLCYLEPGEAADVIRYFASRIPNLAIVIYEPTKPDDPFGRQMVSNLAARNIRMSTMDSFKQPADQETRLKDAGFEHVEQRTVDEIWNSWISAEEKERVDSLEGLDEIEEWQLLAGHYVVAWGWKGSGFEGLAGVS